MQGGGDVVKRQVLAMTMLGLVLCSGACSTGTFSRASRAEREHYLKTYDLRRSAHGDIPIVINDRVIAWLEYFQGPGRSHFERYLARSGRYQKLMETILADAGLPRDLVYISLIESGFNPAARSHANAVGAWQFISGTGRRYGLERSSWVDERHDVVKATEAAAHFFKDLYAEFNDWYLAMAAYNAGEGKLRRAIAASGSNDFWQISAAGHRYLRPETRDYVPKFIAAAIIAKAPEKFGFEKPSPVSIDFDTVVVESPTDVNVIAECAQTSPTEIQELNPELIRYVTPPTRPTYEVKIPKGKARAFQVAYAAYPPEKRVQVVTHRVRRGETVARIARRYHVSAQLLASTNGIGVRQKIRPGTKLMIPRGRMLALADLTDASEPKAHSREPRATKIKQTHLLTRGETIGDVARHYHVGVRELMAWNHIRDARRVPVGKRLVVRALLASASTPEAPPAEPVEAGNEPIALAAASSPTPAAKTSEALSYRVRRGDNLWKIARRHGVSIVELQSWNGLTDTSAVRPGDRLTIKLSHQ